MEIINRHTHKYQPDLYVVVFCHISFRILKKQKHSFGKKVQSFFEKYKMFLKM